MTTFSEVGGAVDLDPDVSKVEDDHVREVVVVAIDLHRDRVARLAGALACAVRPNIGVW